MKLIDRYIMSELIGPFLFGIAAFSSILAGSTVLFSLIGFAVKYGAPWVEVAKIFFYRLPGIVAFTMPMSMLLTSILVVSRLNSDLEIVALRAGGVHIFRVVAPVVMMGFFVSLGTVWFNEFVVPRANRSAEAIDDRIQHSGRPKLQQNINYTEFSSNGLPRRLINAARIKGDTMHEITMAEYEKGQLARIICATSGEWVPGTGWQLSDGVMHVLDQANIERVMIMHFGSELIRIPIKPYELSKTNRKAEDLNAIELAQQIELKEKTGQSAVSDQVKWNLKFSVPFASLIFSILGAAVSLRPVRSTSSVGMGLSLLIIVVYYVVMSVCMGLGLSQIVPPVAAAWLPNVLVGIVGLVFLRRRLIR